VIVGLDLIVRDGVVVTQPHERASTDRSVHGWKKLMSKDPIGAASKLDAIIKNTYRTLMTRGQKGCYVYFVDDETRQYFENCIRYSSREEVFPIKSEKESEIPPLPFRVLNPDEVKPFENCVPLYDLKVAAGSFSAEQLPMENVEWVQLPDVFRPKEGLFVSQVVGESMNRRIPNGAWCLFSANPIGSRQGKVVIVEHRDIADSDTGGRYTVKIYESIKKHISGNWSHTSIKLRPDTTHSGYQEIALSASQAKEMRVVAELVAVLG
jgi:hypothetical protein